MTKDLAVIICNWNKRDDLLKCIDSVLQSDYQRFDLFVVDNASTDGSADAVITAYGDRIAVIRNKINSGGSGGFNSGMRAVLNKGYSYICLLDNDVILEKNALNELYSLLESDENIAAVGAKILSMSDEGRLQEFGAKIAWDQYNLSPFYKGHREQERLPDIIDSDYVPACAVLVRVEVIRKVGLMDESFFIYWDDVEWFYRMKRNGYRIVACNRAVVRHKMGAAAKTSTFATYYFWRNRIRFFLNVLETSEHERFMKTIFAEAFQAIYFSAYQGQFHTGRTIISAIKDALQKVGGMAAPNRILAREVAEDRLQQALKNSQVVQIRTGTVDQAAVERLVHRLRGINPHLKIMLDQNCHHSADGYTIQMVHHIKEAKSSVRLDEIDCYIDNYGHVALSELDYMRIDQFPAALEACELMFLPMLLEIMK